MQGKLFFKCAALSVMALGLTIGVYSPAQAVGPYILGVGLNNENPADMSTTGQYDITIDGLSYNFHRRVTATILGRNGSAQSGRTNILPYFHLAYRLDPK